MLHGLIEKVENKDPSLADAKVVSKAFKASGLLIPRPGNMTRMAG